MLQKNRNLNYTYGSTGPGSFMNVMGEAFKRDAGVEMTHVPLKGAAPLKQELLAGRLHVGGDQWLHYAAAKGAVLPLSGDR